MNKVVLKASEPYKVDEFTVNGIDLSFAKSVTINVNTSEVPTVTVVFSTTELDIETNGRVLSDGYLKVGGSI